MICKERAYATIKLENIQSNINSIASSIDKNCKIMAVVKTDGYGHGAIKIAKELDSNPSIGAFAVATIEEAMELKDAGIKADILILGYCFPSAYETIINNDIRATVFDYETAIELDDIAKKTGKKAIVHLKVDTGMSRIGMLPDEEGLNLIKKINSLSNITIEGIFTHFARADETNKSFANKQLDLFKSFIKQIEEAGITIPIKHCSNSAAIVDMPSANMNMVRAGIIIYGLWPSKEVSHDALELKPAMELKSTVVYVKDVKSGTQISYGGTFTADKDMKLATVSIGYGDGYPRVLSNKGYVLIRGKKAYIKGRVCMDQLMVDVTDIDGVTRGDTVTLIGQDANEIITMEEFSELVGTINYESVCDIGKRVPRIYI